MPILKARLTELRLASWSSNTWKTRKSQWRKYLDFCEVHELEPLPASIDTICLYISYLTFAFQYSSITNYLSAVWRLHDWFGYSSNVRDSFAIKCTLAGAKRVLGSRVVQCTPLLPKDLLKILKVLYLRNYMTLVIWCMILLCFRCLLRKSHVTDSPHNLSLKDIMFTDYGMDVYIRSSKTIQFQERELVLPIVESKSPLCPVKCLRDYLDVRPATRSTELFVDRRGRPITYKYYCSSLKKFCILAGLRGYFATHSLRRGGALFLSSIGLPLHEIQTYGDWRSLSVLLYLGGTKKSKRSKDVFVAKCLSRY